MRVAWNSDRLRVPAANVRLGVRNSGAGPTPGPADPPAPLLDGFHRVAPSGQVNKGRCAVEIFSNANGRAPSEKGAQISVGRLEVTRASR